MYSRILVPLDGSTLSEAILPHSTALAQKFDATLVLLRVSISQAQAVRQTVVPEPAAGAPLSFSVAQELVDAQSEAAEAYLKRVAQGLTDSGVRCEALLMDGDPVLALRQAVKDQQIDLITMATHGRSGLGRLFQGSVAEGLLHEVAIPMLLLHAKG